MNDIEQAIEMMSSDFTIKSVTKYLTPKSVIRVTRRLKPRKGNKRNEFVVTIGTPNYLSAIFIKICVKAKEPFPVLKLQPSFYPKKKTVKNKGCKS